MTTLKRTGALVDHRPRQQRRACENDSDPNLFFRFLKHHSSKQEFLPSPPSPPHVSPESHGFPVYPVSNSQELGKELEELALRNACTERDTAQEEALATCARLECG